MVSYVITPEEDSGRQQKSIMIAPSVHEELLKKAKENNVRIGNLAEGLVRLIIKDENVFAKVLNETRLLQKEKRDKKIVMSNNLSQETMKKIAALIEADALRKNKTN